MRSVGIPGQLVVVVVITFSEGSLLTGVQLSVPFTSCVLISCSAQKGKGSFLLVSGALKQCSQGQCRHCVTGVWGDEAVISSS